MSEGVRPACQKNITHQLSVNDIYIYIYKYSQSRDNCVIFLVLIEYLYFTYEAGPKLNEAKVQGSASSALAWR